MLSQKDEIKNKLDIKEVIGQYVKLQKAGSSYKGLCPFHNDKTPSFFVSPSRQIWHCFGCGAGGDIFTFIMKIENVDFPTALRILAEKAGVKLRFENPQRRSEKEKLIQINESASQFFEENLWQNQEVLEYLQKRGLEEETIKLFHLGWAPDDWRSLLNFLTKKGYQAADIIAAGLAINKEEPTEISNRTQNRKCKVENCYDRFRSRIMFPINDAVGHHCGFTGRVFKGKDPLKTIRDIEQVGKYVNTPQSLIFDKSTLLYGLFQSKKYLHEEGCTLLVEGQMDFLAAWQAGIKNVAATSGTALTDSHLNLLKRYNQNLILGFDMDEAGEKAAERSISLALTKDMEVKILQLPQEKDLADYLLKKENQEKLKKLIKQAEPVMEFYFSRAKEQGDKNTIKGKKSIASYFLPRIKKLASALERSFWIEKIAHYLELPARILEDELNNLKIENSRQIDENDSLKIIAPSLQSRIDILVEKILALLVRHPSLKELALSYESYFPAPQKKIFQIIQSTHDDNAFLKENITKLDIDESLIDQINQLALRGDYETEMLEQYQVSIEDELKNGLEELKTEAIKRKLRKLGSDITEAEKNMDKGKIKDLMKEFNQLSKKLIS